MDIGFLGKIGGALGCLWDFSGSVEGGRVDTSCGGRVSNF